jgi:hypothetical protein
MRPQVVGTRLRDLEIDKRADRQLARHEDQTVDLRRMTPSAADGDRLGVARFALGLQLELTDRLNQHLQRLTYQRLVFAQRDRLLRLHDRVAPLFGNVCRHRG